MDRARLFLAFVCAVLAGPAHGEIANFAVPGGNFEVPVESMEALKFTETVRQGYDFSCGSAALATLLTYHYGRKVSEEDVFRAMWEAGDAAKIRNAGFSMLDMKRFLGTRGLLADGFKLEATKIGAVGVAGIVLLDKLASPHFVVVIGEKDGELLLSDPARGIWNLAVEEFDALWNGVFFVVRQEASTARGNFNDSETWKRARWSPVGDERLSEMLVPRLIDLPFWAEFNAN